MKDYDNCWWSARCPSIRVAKPGSKSASGWLLQLLERKPRKLAAVALANKMARIIWAMMARGEAYRRQPVTA